LNASLTTFSSSIDDIGTRASSQIKGYTFKLEQLQGVAFSQNALAGFESMIFWLVDECSDPPQKLAF